MTPSEERNSLLSACRDDVLKVAADLDSAYVVLVADTRDDLGADLAAQLYVPNGTMSGPEMAAHYTEAASTVGRFTEEHASAGRVPVVTAPVRREWIVRALNAVGLDDLAVDLECESEKYRVLIVGSGGVRLEALPA